jgi:hypothetical protein
MKTETNGEAKRDPLPYKLAGSLFLGRVYKCALCGKVIEGFRDRVSAKEFRITGTCQSCQDDLFGKEDR